VPTPTTNAPARSLWAPLALVAVTVLAYANTFSAPFVFDDIPTIVDNPAIRHLWPLGDLLFPSVGGLTLAGRPLLALSLALNYAISGTAVWSYHATNLLIHLLAGLTLFGLLRLTLRRPALPITVIAAELPLAFVIALLWTIHPLQTQAVTYIVQRAEALMGLCFLFTFYAFARGLTSPRPWRWWSVALTVCTLGMGAKEVMATAPVLVFLYDRTFFAGTFARAWRERSRFYLGLAATWLPLAVFILSTGGNRGGTVGLGVGVTPWAYALTQFEAVTRYLALTVFPIGQSFEYGTFWVTDPLTILPYAFVLIPLLAATIYALWRRPLLGFAGAWFFVILSPTSLTPGTIQMIVEHRPYLSLAAPLSLIVLGLHRWLGRRSLWLFGGLALACITLTFLRNATYQSAYTLWADAVVQRPKNPIALNNLGEALFKLDRVPEAIARYQEALRYAPIDAKTNYNLAIAYERIGRRAESLALYAEIVRRKPDFAEAHSNYGFVLLQTGRTAEAQAEFETALRLKPTLPEAHNNLGNLLLQSGRIDEAIRSFQAAIKLRPAYAEAHYNLGNAVAQQGDMPGAITHYAEAHVNYGNALLQLERIPEAITHYEAAIRLQPSLYNARNNLGYVFLHTGRLNEAIEQFTQALVTQPDFADAQRNLAEARAALAAQEKR
jgi:tetratricopeptide (TPR) repeat protein